MISNQRDGAVHGHRKPEQPGYEIPTDHDLLVAANTGCGEAFATLFHRHSDDLMQYVLRQTGNTEQAEDLVQETFVDTLHSLGRIPEDRPFRGWLFRTAQNNFLDDARRMRKRRGFSLERLIDSTKRIRRELREDDFSERVSDIDALQGVLAELSVEQREPLILSGKGYSSQEIARKLNISDAAARQRTSRAMRYVRKRYQELGL